MKVLTGNFVQQAASKSEPAPFVASFCDRFRDHILRLGDDPDATFVNACSSRYSSFRTLVQSALGTRETPADSVVSHMAHSQELAAIRKDVVALIQCMADEQLIDLLCTALPHFKQLWLSADASSLHARRRLLQEIDPLTVETVLTLMAESSRFRLIALECNDRHQLTQAIEKGIWERIQQAVKYLLGKPEAAESATAAGLQVKVCLAIFLGGSAAVGAGIHHHVAVKSHAAAQAVPVISHSAPAIPVPVAAAPSAAISASVAITALPRPEKLLPAGAHKPAGAAKTADAQQHRAPTHVAKKDNSVAAENALKTPEATKTDVAAHKKGIFGFLKKAAGSNTAETEEPSTPPSQKADAQSSPPAKNTGAQSNANTQKKGFFGFLKKSRHKNDKSNASSDNASADTQ